MDTIIICLNGKPAEEVAKIEGVITAINWDAVMPTINDLVRLRPYEQVDGLIVSDTDIRVKISQKRGRKTSKA